MNKFKYFFILLIAGAALVSCNKDDDDDDIKVEPPRDYKTQYEAEKAIIDEYLSKNYIEITESPGNVEDMDVVIKPIDNAATQVAIISYKNNVGTSVYPQLKSRNVDFHGITYELYYLVLREGTGEVPMNTDGVLTSYNGNYLTSVAKTDTDPAYIKATFFEQIIYPKSVQDLAAVIMGWAETFPQFKTGKATVKTNGNISYTDFGAGVMFIPSGLGYYNTGKGSIPAYAPLVFSFKLYEMQRLDHDSDGVLDYNEDINGDGYVYDYRNTTFYPNAPAVNPDDTDGDGVPDFIDTDDDGDGYTTLLEITKPSTKVGVVNGVNYGPSRYFPFEAFVVEDDPLPNPPTPNIDESLNSEPKGIPAFLKTELIPDPSDPTGVKKIPVNIYDYTTAGRLKIHLDKLHNTTKVTTVTAKK
jgi:FKBP-type peptidyl-prolyl cis-trans isomerase